MDETVAFETTVKLQFEFETLINTLFCTPAEMRRPSDIRKVHTIRNHIDALRRQCSMPSTSNGDQPMFDQSLRRKMDLLFQQVSSSLEGLACENDPKLETWRALYDKLESQFLEAVCLTGTEDRGRQQLAILCEVRGSRNNLFTEIVKEKKKLIAQSEVVEKPQKMTLFERLTTPKDKPKKKIRAPIPMSWSASRDDLLGLLNEFKANVFHAVRQCCDTYHLLDPDVEAEAAKLMENAFLQPRTLSEDGTGII